ncbi:MAG: HlyD family efflux transporter periplasmic adaptor subunit [Bacteroidales bacterium]|nr:HlyD family efflux transporter periplasmic adaptor subunit [Bacteroidales bacterium]
MTSLKLTSSHRLGLYLCLMVFILTATSCRKHKNDADAYGVCEATEITVSSEANGKMLEFKIHEGETYGAGEVVGCIDTFQTYLQIKQLESSIKAALARRPNATTQIRVLDDKLSTLNKEKQRVSNLIEANAASTKQLDDIQAEINITKSQIAATKSTLSTQDQSLLEEVEALRFQLQQLQHALESCHIKTPIAGTIINKYIEESELAYQGKPLFKIADLNNMFIKVYITEDQLSSIKLNQKAVVRLDKPDGKFIKLDGKVTWISPKAEFTPKMIQTKDERANLVYAVKVSFKNDGSAKIGMPGDVLFK